MLTATLIIIIIESIASLVGAAYSLVASLGILIVVGWAEEGAAMGVTFFTLAWVLVATFIVTIISLIVFLTAKKKGALIAMGVISICVGAVVSGIMMLCVKQKLLDDRSEKRRAKKLAKQLD